MKSLFKFSLSILAISVLAACSSGGDSSSNTASDGKTIVNSGGTGGTGSTGGSGDTAGDKKDPVTPLTPTYSGVWSSTTTQPADIAESSNSDVIVIQNGDKTTTLNLQNTSLNSPGVSLKSMSRTGNLTYIRFNDSNLKDKDGMIAEQLLVYGKTTAVADVPTEGKFSYKGSAIYGSEALDGFIGNAVANLTVDFGANTVDGTITQAEKGVNLTLPTAKIEGNGFVGNKDNAFIKGQFFGEKATQIGGVFGDNGDAAYTGAFGATKAR